MRRPRALETPLAVTAVLQFDLLGIRNADVHLATTAGMPTSCALPDGWMTSRCLCLWVLGVLASPGLEREARAIILRFPLLLAMLCSLLSTAKPLQGDLIKFRKLGTSRLSGHSGLGSPC